MSRRAILLHALLERIDGLGLKNRHRYARVERRDVPTEAQIVEEIDPPACCIRTRQSGLRLAGSTHRVLGAAPAARLHDHQTIGQTRLPFVARDQLARKLALKNRHAQRQARRGAPPCRFPAQGHSPQGIRHRQAPSPSAAPSARRTPSARGFRPLPRTSNRALPWHSPQESAALYAQSNSVIVPPPLVIIA